MDHHDARLIERILAGRDEDAFRALVVRHAPAGIRLAQSVTRDPGLAEDAVQEAFFALSRKLRRFDRTRPFRAWFLGIVYRCALKAASKRARHARHEEPQEVASMTPRTPEEPHEAAALAETRRAVEEELSRLAPEHRVALLLHYGESLTYDEVAESLSIRPGTAKSRVSRALDALRGNLERRGVALGAGLEAVLARLPAAQPSPALVEACVGKGMAGLVATSTGSLVLWASGAAAVAVTALAVGISVGNRDAGPDRADTRRVVARDDAQPPQVASDARTRATASTRHDDAQVGERSALVQPADPAGGITANGDGTTPPTPTPAPTGTAADGDGELHVGPGGRLERGALGGARIERGTAGTGTSAGPPTGGQPLRAPRGIAPDGTQPPKFAQPPRTRGEATLTGRVVDSTGNPIPGAEIWRIVEDAPFDPADPVMSAEFMNRIGTAGEDGLFTIGQQREGRVILFANHGGVLNVPMRGLDTSHRREFVVPQGGRIDGVVLTVPIAFGDAVALEGRVVDEAGEPVAGAQVWVDTRLRVVSDADGRFDFGKVQPGPVTVTAQSVGYEDAAQVLTLEPRATEVLTLTMKLLHAGDQRLAGQLLDTRGNPVPNAQLYLTGGNGTLRKLRTDAGGRFAFESLPAEIAELDLALSVWPPDGWYPAHVKPVAFPSDALDLRVEVALPLRFTVVSAADAAPLQQIRYEIRVPKIVDGEETWIARVTGSRFVENGVLDGNRVPFNGRVRLFVEAPGHQPWEADLDTNPAGDRVELTVTLAAGSAEPESD